MSSQIHKSQRRIHKHRYQHRYRHSSTRMNNFYLMMRFSKAREFSCWLTYIDTNHRKTLLYTDKYQHSHIQWLHQMKYMMMDSQCLHQRYHSISFSNVGRNETYMSNPIRNTHQHRCTCHYKRRHRHFYIRCCKFDLDSALTIIILKFLTPTAYIDTNRHNNLICTSMYQRSRNLWHRQSWYIQMDNRDLEIQCQYFQVDLIDLHVLHEQSEP